MKKYCIEVYKGLSLVFCKFVHSFSDLVEFLSVTNFEKGVNIVVHEVEIINNIDIEL